MSSYTSPKKSTDLIQRTKRIIEQYDERESYLGTEFYDVTLLLNCLLGVVVLPREEELDMVVDEPLPIELNNTVTYWNGTLSFKNYIIGLRNAIVHFGKNDSLSFDTESDKITKIKLFGLVDKSKTIHFEFNLTDGNELKVVVDEILAYLYPALS